MKKRQIFSIGVLLFLLHNSTVLAGPMRQEQGGTGTDQVIPAGRTVQSDGQKYVPDMSVIDIKKAGAKCDVEYPLSNSITAGTNVLTVPGRTFTAADVGKFVIMPGQTVTGGVLRTSIIGVSGGNALLADNAVIGTGKIYSPGGEFVARGTGYFPTQTITIAGGTSTVPTILTIRKTALSSLPTVNTAGSGGKDGTWQVYGTTGNGNRFVLNVTITGGALASVDSIADAGHYTLAPPDFGNEPIAGAGLTGASVNITGMGIDSVEVTTPGVYTVLPANPVAQASTSGSGTGATLTMSWQYNSFSIMFGSDDGAKIQQALNGSNKKVIVPEGSCGTTQTLEIKGDNVHLLGAGYSKIPHGGSTTIPNNGLLPGSTLQWLGAQGGGPVLRLTSDGTDPGVGNRVSGFNIMCTANRTYLASSFFHLADVGMEMYAQTEGEFDHLAFASCRRYGWFMSSIVGQVGSGNAHNDIRHIFSSHLLPYDGIGLFLSGATDGTDDTGAQVISDYFGFFHNSPAMQLVTLDAGRGEMLHFVAVNANPGIPAMDFSGSVYGSGDSTLHSDLYTAERVIGDIMVRGLETSSVPPRDITLIDVMENAPFSSPFVEPVVMRPGHNRVTYRSSYGEQRMGGHLQIGQGSTNTSNNVDMNPGDLHLDGKDAVRLIMSDTSLAGNQRGAIVFDGGDELTGGGWMWKKLADDGGVLAILAHLRHSDGHFLVNALAETGGIDVSKQGVGSVAVRADLSANFLNGMTEVGDSGIFSVGNSVGIAPGFVIAPWMNGTGGLRVDAAGRVGISTPTVNSDSKLEIAGHIAFEGTPPTVSACGTSPAINPSSNDVAGFVTIGGGGTVTSCTLTFITPFPAKPPCQVLNTSAVVAIRGTSTATTLEIASVADIAGHVISYFCPSLG